MLKLSGCSRLSWGRIWSQRPPPRWKVDGQSKFPKCCTHPASTNADSPQQGDNITARRHKTRNMACISADRTTLGTDDHLRSSPMPCRERVYVGCDAQTDVPSTEASGANCVQKLDDSRDSAIHTKYRISLRSSS